MTVDREKIVCFFLTRGQRLG